MAQARTRFFLAHGLATDGGYDDPYVEIEVAGLRLRIPNTRGRRRAVPYHDMHHVLTGYDTDMAGESEISAWELATGCRDLVAAWILNSGAYAYGLLVCPRRVYRAFVRGRHSRNLYARPFDAALLEAPVDALRRDLGLDDSAPVTAGLGDKLWFVLSVVLTLGPPLTALFAVVRVILWALG